MSSTGVDLLVRISKFINRFLNVRNKFFVIVNSITCPCNFIISLAFYDFFRNIFNYFDNLFDYFWFFMTCI